jgi:UDP-N-acetyl-D-mannosaminuronic acid dehydrogenase
MKKITTIGLGYIGLPTSALIASKGFEVNGVDINQKVVETINKGEIHIVEPELDIVVKDVVSKGLLKASTEPQASDVYLIVVPTPFKGDHEPDISYIESATKAIIPILKENDLYIIESTSPIGTTELMSELIFTYRPELRNKLFIAYCPERVLPGNVMFELVNNDRVIGGIDEVSTQKAIDFYREFVEGNLHPTNSKTAEMCKLTENASRDVQIAFANELSLICDKADIDVWELIHLANKHPRVNILQPGCGVGGHCIAVDPYFISSNFPLESKIIRSAREVNNYKAFWCVEKIHREIHDFEIHNKRKPIIALCGLTFKPDIDDIRESPALHICQKIKQTYDNSLLFFVDPNIKQYQDFNIKPIEEINKTDIAFILVGHKEFRAIFSNESLKIVSFVSTLK